MLSEKALEGKKLSYGSPISFTGDSIYLQGLFGLGAIYELDHQLSHLRGSLIVLLLSLQLLSGVLVDNNPNDHVILAERDDVPVFQDEVPLNFDECAGAVPQILKHVGVLLVRELDDEVLGAKTFPWR